MTAEDKKFVEKFKGHWREYRLLTLEEIAHVLGIIERLERNASRAQGKLIYTLCHWHELTDVEKDSFREVINALDYTAKMNLSELRELCKVELDCGDNSCEFTRNRGGMRTNGGCRCVKDIGPFPVRRRVTASIKMLPTLISLLERAEKMLIDIYPVDRDEETAQLLSDIAELRGEK